MCAIFGWLDVKGIIPYAVLRKLTQALANAAEERGTDAAGISYVENGKIQIYKRPKPAHKVKFKFPKGTKAVMGHTRMTTQGNAEYNWNNHPFPGKADKEFAFAHNGVLYNDGMLRKMNNLPKTAIETDSYVAVQLIEKNESLNFDSLRSMAEEVHGSFMFTILDEDNTLYFVKGENPIEMVYFHELGIYIYASTKSILYAALKKAGLTSGKVSLIELVEGDMLSITSEGKMERSEFNIYSNRSICEWYDMSCFYEEEYLLDLCDTYGIDTDTVFLLLDYGYTVMDIENMIENDPESLYDICAAIEADETDEDNCFVSA